MHGIKHIIQCRCILPTLKNKKDPPLHQFVVFSTLNNKNELVEEKYSQCNNCGIVHKIIDVCKSEIIHNKEALNSALTIEDIKLSLPENVVNILSTYNCDLATYEHVKFMYENDVYDEFTVLTREMSEDSTRIEGKALRYKKGKTFSIEPFSSQDLVDKK